MSVPARLRFELLASDGAARRGRLQFARGSVETPAFMPVGTYGTVKAMTPEELVGLGAQIVLGNTFHLMLRPGLEVIAAHGEPAWLHALARPHPDRFGRLPGVQPRGDCARSARRACSFRSPVDGSQVFLSPEESMRVQRVLGSDIAMSFDECTPYPGYRGRSTRIDGTLDALGAAQSPRTITAMRRPARCSASCRAACYGHLRLESLAALEQIGFAGLAVGGLAVGESEEERDRVLDVLLPQLPRHKPRYLMGVGRPEDIVAGRRAGHRHVRLRDADAPCPQWPPVHARRRHQHPQCRAHRATPARSRPAAAAIPAATTAAATCATWTDAARSSAARLNTIHNLYFYQRLMAEMRAAIAAGRLCGLSRRLLRATAA